MTLGHKLAVWAVKTTFIASSCNLAQLRKKCQSSLIIFHGRLILKPRIIEFFKARQSYVVRALTREKLCSA